MIEKNMADLRKELKQLISMLEMILIHSKNKNNYNIENLRYSTQKFFDKAINYLGDYSEHIVEQSRHFAHLTKKLLDKKPWAVVGIGTTLGLLLGLFLMRR
ncbi:MAG: hypothetical protein V6007_01095 [Candidatus Dasytiphilus stammeri]